MKKFVLTNFLLFLAFNSAFAAKDCSSFPCPPCDSGGGDSPCLYQCISATYPTGSAICGAPYFKPPSPHPYCFPVCNLTDSSITISEAGTPGTLAKNQGSGFREDSPSPLTVTVTYGQQTKKFEVKNNTGIVISNVGDDIKCSEWTADQSTSCKSK